MNYLINCYNDLFSLETLFIWLKLEVHLWMYFNINIIKKTGYCQHWSMTLKKIAFYIESSNKWINKHTVSSLFHAIIHFVQESSLIFYSKSQTEIAKIKKTLWTLGKRKRWNTSCNQYNTIRYNFIAFIWTIKWQATESEKRFNEFCKLHLLRKSIRKNQVFLSGFFFFYSVSEY